MLSLERSLLHTYRSKFTQFLIFYACKREPHRCCASLVRVLLSRLASSQTAAITRAACAAYLASFLARSAFVSESLVVNVLQRLADLAANYVANVDAAAATRADRGAAVVVLSGRSAVVHGPPGAGAAKNPAASLAAATASHQVFYAVVQALLYILCYHLEPLVSQQPQHPHSKAEHATSVAALVCEKLLPLLQHRLAPLAVCLPSVSSEFARQAAALQLADVAPLLPAAAGAQPGPGCVGVEGGVVRAPVRPLEMFFPFDPYLLRRSASLLDLDKSFVRWRAGHPQAAAPGSESSDEGSYDDEVGWSESADSDSSEDERGSSLRGGSLDSSGVIGSLPPTSGPGVLLHKNTSLHRPLPVGLAAVGGVSPSPNADLMATSLAGQPFLNGVSYSPGGVDAAFGGYTPGAAMYGASPYASPMHSGGVSPHMGQSPMGMSITPYEGYMASVQQQLQSVDPLRAVGKADVSGLVQR